MGLLRRATVASGHGTVNREAPGGPAPESPRRAGLLRRSLKARRDSEPAQPFSLQAQAPSGPAALSIELADRPLPQRTAPVAVPSPAPSEPIPQPPTRGLEEVSADVRHAIETLPAGIELPSRLFTVLSELLGFRRAALLLYDPRRLVYAPWAQRGYDPTTQRRMRIPLGANEAWNALANGAPIVLTDPASLAPFQPYFSAREFGSVSRLILVPFIAEEKLAAVLFVTDLDSPLSSDQDLVACLSGAAVAGAPRVQQARAARLATGQAPAPEPQDETARFVSALEGSREPVLLVSLSLDDCSRDILADHGDLDPFRLHEDLQFFLGSFLADLGTPLAVRPGRFLLGMPGFPSSTLDLFAHQLSRFLDGLFGGGGSGDGHAGPRILKTASWPTDGPALRSLVETLSS